VPAIPLCVHQSIRACHPSVRPSAHPCLPPVCAQLHDYKTLNRQGGDVGTQYRSAIWYTSDSQREAIEASRAALTDAARVVTKVEPVNEGFIWAPAEAYHQQYLQKDGQDASRSSLAPIQCYGKRGPVKKMDKPGIREILKGEL
jgi:hypothetical protein